MFCHNSGKSGCIRTQFNEQLPFQEECPILSIWDAKDGTLFLRWRLPIELCLTRPDWPEK